MVLTDKTIRTLVKEKNLIEPFDEKHLQSESYDVSIGDKIITLEQINGVLDIAKQEFIDAAYNESEFPNTGYVIPAKKYILVSVLEKITLGSDITAHIRPRTRYTRLGLWVSDQHCNSTYSGNLKIGLFNATDYPIKIYKGASVAQIIFEQLDREPSAEKLYKNRKDASYQNENGRFVGAKFDDDFIKQIWDRMLDEK